MSYESQLEEKHRVLEHMLNRVGLDTTKLLPIIGCAYPTHYRHRIQIHFREGKWGFYQKRSNDLVEIDSCLIAHESLNEKLKHLRAQAFSPNDEKKRLELRVGEGATEGFIQPNLYQNEVLQAYITLLLKKINTQVLLELFCGDGNLTKPILPELKSYVGVDSSAACIELAETRFRGVEHVTFMQSLVNFKLIEHLPKTFKDRYDTLLLDPPRQGAGKSLVRFVSKNLTHIIYVSCAPITFTRDIHCLAKRGFVLQSIQPFDMFPQTRHIELVALFSRSSSL